MSAERATHPYTPLLTSEDERGRYVPKIPVRLSDGSIRSLRPRWIGMFHGQAVNAWCVQRWGCPQQLTFDKACWPSWKTGVSRTAPAGDRS